jgi:hypothetical protein
MKKHNTHPAFINSSHLLLFLVFSGLISRFLVLPFHIYGELIPWLVTFTYTVVLYVAWYWLNQLIEEDHIVLYFVIVFLFFPLLAGLLLNSLVGTLQDGTVPILHGIGIFHWQTIHTMAYPSVLLNYGIFAFAFSLLMAGPCEWVVCKATPRMAKNGIYKKLLALDRRIDDSSASFTTNYFHTTDRGLLVGTITLIVYLALSIAFFS